jgi:hypothetical protein
MSIRFRYRIRQLLFLPAILAPAGWLGTGREIYAESPSSRVAIRGVSDGQEALQFACAAKCEPTLPMASPPRPTRGSPCGLAS